MEELTTEYFIDLYNKCIEIATKAHEGQIDKVGQPYIEHPKRVARNVLAFLTKDGDDSVSYAYQVACVAMLHDVFEDTEITVKDLEELGIYVPIIHGIQSVTRRSDESYMDFIKRACNDYYGIYVKLFDLEDNLDIKRLSKLTEEDMNRCNKYLKARKYILNKLNETIKN